MSTHTEKLVDEILELFAITHVRKEEKELWLEVIDRMTHEQLTDLRDNLRKQAEVEAKLYANTLNGFVKAVESSAASIGL